MNVVVARHKATLLNPESSPEHKAAAVAELTEIANDSSGPKRDDAIFALRELEACTDSVQAAFGRRPVSDPSNPEHPDHYWFLFAEWKTRQEEFYGQAKADGLDAAATVAKLRRSNPSPAAAATFGILTQKAEACKQGGEHVAKTHFCPEVYRIMRETEINAPFDWCSLELAKSILAEYNYEPSEADRK